MTDQQHSNRPALVKLTDDLEDLRDELLAGFPSRRAVLEWMQQLSVRTLGQLPDRWFDELGAQFRGVPESGEERTLLSALLNGSQRTRGMDDETAKELRERLYALTIRPAYHRAFRQLRADAGEYLDGGETDSQQTAANQKWIAMRPALDELEEYQKRALGDLLDGLEDKSAILNWGNDLEQATHGELPGEFVARCYREESTAEILTGRSTTVSRARELFWADHLAPIANAGVRDLGGRTSEQPDTERQANAPTQL